MSGTDPSVFGVGATAAIVVVLLGARAAASIGPDRLTRRPRGWRHTIGGRWFARKRRPGPPGDVDVAAWCEYAARALRSGHSICTALAQATRDEPSLQPTMTPVLVAVQRGHPLPEALTRMSPTGTRDAAGRPGVTMVASVLRTCAELGGPAAAPLDRVAGLLRMRAAVADEQHAQSAQARLSARVLTIVPIALLALLACSDATVRAAIATPAGGAAIAAGTALNVAGWCWMRRIIAVSR